jgi:23S rRNA (uracil1939-C5)-methyltransferase
MSALPAKARPGPAVLKAGELHEMQVVDLLANGQGVGRVAGQVIFVWGPLPGERARVRVTLVKAKYAVAELVELLEVSPHRVEAFCPVFGVCGGCQVQHLAYPAQLAWKRSVVRSALRRIGGFENAAVAPTIGMDEPRAYRNKMALVVQPREAAVDFGFYQARSHELVRVERCPVVLPRLNAYIGALYAAAADTRTAGAFREARHVVARVGERTGQGVLSITTDRAQAAVARSAPELARRLEGAVGISNSFEPGSANAVLGRRYSQSWGSPEMEEHVERARFRVSAASFFQVNTAMVARIFAFIAPALQRPVRIVDLYCGAGTFSVFFAGLGCEVVGIEENASAVREARVNAELNGVAPRARMLEGKVERALRTAEGVAALAAADLVFLDPPRKGSDEATLEAIADAGVAAVWYLSCNPATLARDLAVLGRRGYELDAVQPFDMFPQTGHVETLVTMLHREKPAAVRLASAAGEETAAWPERTEHLAEEFDES